MATQHRVGIYAAWECRRYFKRYQEAVEAYWQAVPGRPSPLFVKTRATVNTLWPGFCDRSKRLNLSTEIPSPGGFQTSTGRNSLLRLALTKPNYLWEKAHQAIVDHFGQCVGRAEEEFRHAVSFWFLPQRWPGAFLGWVLANFVDGLRAASFSEKQIERLSGHFVTKVVWLVMGLLGGGGAVASTAPASVWAASITDAFRNLIAVFKSS